MAPSSLDEIEWPPWLQEAHDKSFDDAGRLSVDAAGNGYINTLEGEMAVSKGDWIIRGVQGELYPCKPDIFEATYEAAPADTAEETDVPNLEDLATEAGLDVKAYRNGYGSVTCVIADPKIFPGPVAVTGDYFEACDFVRSYRKHKG